MIVKKKIDGFKMILNLTDGSIGKRMLITNGNREPGFKWILCKEASGIAYDIGANIGQYTLHLGKLCDKVYAFEPDERSFKYLDKNIRLNKLENVILTKTAIYNKLCKVRMDMNEKHNLNAIKESMGIHWAKGNGIVQADSIDRIPYVSPDFIKMDIEGGEIKAFQGAWDTIFNADKLKLLVEVHPDKYNEVNDFAPILWNMIEAGYYFKYVVNAKGKMNEFTKQGYKPIKTFKKYKHRSVFKDIPPDLVIPWATEMPDDGKKVIRSFLLVKE